MVDKKAASSDAAFLIGSSGHLSSSIGIGSSLIVHRHRAIGSSRSVIGSSAIDDRLIRRSMIG